MKDEKDTTRPDAGGAPAPEKPSRARNHTVLLDPGDIESLREKLAGDIKRGLVDVSAETAPAGEEESAPAAPQFLTPPGAAESTSAGFEEPVASPEPPGFLSPLGGVAPQTEQDPMMGEAAPSLVAPDSETIMGAESTEAELPFGAETETVGAPEFLAPPSAPQGFDPFGAPTSEEASPEFVAPQDPFSDPFAGDQGASKTADEAPAIAMPAPEPAVMEMPGPPELGGQMVENEAIQQSEGEANMDVFGTPAPIPAQEPVAATGDRIFWRKRSAVTGFLVSYDNDENGEVYQLQSGRLLVTSEDEASGDVLILKHESVSPQHAILKVGKDGEIQVLDQLSEFGTRVLSAETHDEIELSGEKATMGHGDVVQFGERTFYVCCVEKD